MSFLGLGVPAPAPQLGRDARRGNPVHAVSPSASVDPRFSICVDCVCAEHGGIACTGGRQMSGVEPRIDDRKEESTSSLLEVEKISPFRSEVGAK